MSTTENFPTIESALEYRTAHDDRAKVLARKTAPSLRDRYRDHVRRQGSELISGGPVTRQELMTEILAIEFPIALLNEASHVIYHKAGETWRACAWCSAGRRHAEVRAAMADHGYNIDHMSTEDWERLLRDLDSDVL